MAVQAEFTVRDVSFRVRQAICAISALWSLLFWAEANAQKAPIAEWFDIEPDKGAIVLIVSGEVSGLNFSLKSGGKVIDHTKWVFPLPFVKQYRLKPDTYSITSLNVSREIVVKAGKFSIIEFGVKVTDKIYTDIKYYRVDIDRHDLITYPNKLLGKNVKQWRNVLSSKGKVLLRIKTDWPGQLWPVEYIKPQVPKLELVPDRRPPPEK